MSVEATVWAWKVKTGNPTDKLVLLCLADHADEFGRNCWPGQSRIAAKTGLARQTVSVALSRLADKGLIAVDKIPLADNAVFVKNFYRLHVEKPSYPQPNGENGQNVNGANVRVTQDDTDGQLGRPVPVSQTDSNSSLTTNELKSGKAAPPERLTPALEKIRNWEKENAEVKVDAAKALQIQRKNGAS